MMDGSHVRFSDFENNNSSCACDSLPDDALKWTDCCCDRQVEDMELAGETSLRLLEEEHVLKLRRSFSTFSSSPAFLRVLPGG